MPFGTASGRLKKAIMLSLIRHLGMDDCHRCGKAIASPEELSIDHIVDWLGVDVALFWDVDNIAFSHRSCNRPSGQVRGGAGRRRVGPADTAWCGRCKTFLPRGNFAANASRWNGLQDKCRSCNSRKPQGVPLIRACRWCAKPETEVPFVPRRRACVDCYREQQKILMRTRRAAKRVGV